VRKQERKCHKILRMNHTDKFLEANNHLDSGRLDEANELYCELLIESGGYDAPLLCKYGYLQIQLNNPCMGIKIFDTAISVDSGFPWGYIGKGEALWLLGKCDEALVIFKYVKTHFYQFPFITN